MRNIEKPADLEARVLKFIQKHGLIPEGEKVLVAVSGGADSVCLLYTLAALQPELKLRLHIAHLNHQLRGEESERDAQYVKELAERLKVPLTLEKRDVEAYRKEHRLSLEEAAREVRYSYLAETARLTGAGRVATGHTANDQVETILLHIIRGAGTWGLRGLQPYHEMKFDGNKITVIRPLLEISHDDTERYCTLSGLEPCLDTSNLSLSMLRNRVRRELLPLLQSYNPGIYQALERLGRIAQDDQAFLDRESEKARAECTRRIGKNYIINRQKFKGLAPSLQRQVLRKVIDDLLGTLKDIETRHIEEIMEALDKPAGKRISLPEGLFFSLEYDRYVLGFEPEQLSPFPVLEGEYDINITGETRIPGWVVQATIREHRALEEIRSQQEDREQGILEACFDKDQVGDKIKVRTRQKGDRFQPQGMDRTKKVGEFMLDARIPETWRSRIPILYTPQQIIWVAGWRIDERVKVTESTREVLCLKMVRCGNEQSEKSRENSRSPQT